MAEINHDTPIVSGHVCVDSSLKPYSSLVCSQCRDESNVFIVVRSDKMNEVLVRSEAQLWRAICDVFGIDRKTKEPAKAAKVKLVRSAVFERFHQIQLKPFTEGKLKKE